MDYNHQRLFMLFHISYFLFVDFWPVQSLRHHTAEFVIGPGLWSDPKGQECRG